MCTMEQGRTPRTISMRSTASLRPRDPEVSFGDASESIPLLGSASFDTHSTWRSIEHTGSLYSAMIFLPPLTKQRIGHYWTTEVVLGFILLLMNIVMQLSLTIIVGEHIVSQHQDYKTTLLGQSFAFASPWTWLLDHVRERTPDIRNAIEIEGMPWLSANHTDDDDINAKCCNGYSCASSGMTCCNRAGARPANLSRPMGKTMQESDAVQDASSFVLRKPKASSKKRKQDDHESAGDHGDSSLCRMTPADKMQCGPRSYDFLEAWVGLDTNADGIWTLDEALADEANLGCFLGTSLEDIFRSNCRAIINDIHDSNRHSKYLGAPLQIPLSIEEYEAIPRPFFNWWRGIVVICIEGDASVCGNLISRGVFDGAILAERGWTKGGVRDLDTALHYCQRMLEPGGICETAMPEYYQLYRSRVHEMCGKRTFVNGVTYTNPSNNRDVMQTISVTYGNVAQMREYSTWRYRFFLCMTLLMWYICLLEELKDIVQWIDFLACFYIDSTVPIITPGMKEYARDISRRLSRRLSQVSSHFSDLSHTGPNEQLPDTIAEDEEEGAKKSSRSSMSESVESESAPIVESISRLHWVTCFFITALRLWLLIYLFDVGTTFLLSHQSYLDLLLNAVALAMIFELPSTLYSILFSDFTKNELDGARTVEYDTYLPHGALLSSTLLSKFFWGCIILPAMIYWAVGHFHQADIMPIFEALQCTCYQIGARCENADKFTRDWWNGYWADVNGIFAAGQHRHSFHES